MFFQLVSIETSKFTSLAYELSVVLSTMWRNIVFVKGYEVTLTTTMNFRLMLSLPVIFKKLVFIKLNFTPSHVKMNIKPTFNSF